MRAAVLGVVVLGSSIAQAKPLRTVSFGMPHEVCAVEDSGAIRCASASMKPPDLKARDIAVGDDLYLVDEHGKLFAWAGYPRELQPIAVPFAVREIEDVGGTLCALGDRGELACGDPAKRTLEVSAKATFRSLAVDGYAIWLIDDHDGLWCLGGTNCARLHAASKHVAAKTSLRDAAWAKGYPNEVDTGAVPDAPLWRVTDSVKRVFPTGETCIERATEPGTLTCWGFAQAPASRPLPKGDELATVGAHLCARTKDAISCQPLGIASLAPHSFTVKNAVRMFVWGTRFCVENSDGVLACTEPSGQTWPALAPVTWAAP